MNEAALTLGVLEGVPGVDWDAYVDSHAAGSVFHLAAWAAVYAELGWTTPCFLEARRDGRLVGIMPLAEIRYGLSGRALVSAPYCVLAGALADDATVQAALETAAEAEARRRRVDFLEVRQSVGVQPGWPVSQRFCGFARPLAASIEDNLQAIPRKQRAMVRKGEAAGLTVSTGLTLDAFYRLYATSVRNLGTPVYARALLQALARHLAPWLHLFAVGLRGEVIAAVLSYEYRGCVLPYYAGAVPAARELKAYDYLYWQLLCAALARGCTRFDFGRSLCDSGAAAFKRNWGFTAEPLRYQVQPIGAGGAAAELDPDSPFNRIARQAWRHLPLPLANLLGPRLSRRLF